MKKKSYISLLLTFVYYLLGALYLYEQYNVTIISGISLLYSFYLLKRLFDEFGRSLPFKYLILSLMGMQLIISPFFDYYYFENQVYGIMKIDEISYFSYALPCTIALHLGINLFYPKNTNEARLFQLLPIQLKTNNVLSWGLISVGYVFYMLSISINLPSSISFIVTVLAFMRFIGFFYLWFSGSQYTKLAFIIIFIPFVISVIKSTIFIDLIVFTVFITSVYVMKYQTPKWKLILIALIGFWGLFILQSVKYSYRIIVWNENFTGSSSQILADMMLNQINNLGSIDFKTVGAGVNVRLNQGWILTSIMTNIPNKNPIAEGKYIQKELLGLLLPRFLYPEKPVVGDREKFKYMTGWSLGTGVAMNVGIMGDGYGNYGKTGGIVFCFIFGLALGYIFHLFYKISNKYPTLPIWGILIFFYSMRAGNEFYIIANWIIKTGVIVFLYYTFIENNNKINKYITPKPKAALA